MNLDQWRKRQEEGVAASLPSGLDVRLRKLSIPDLIEWGEIPQTLHPQIEQAVYGGTIENRTLEQFGQFQALVTFLAGKALVWPTGVAAQELPWTDRMAIFEWLQEDDGPLRPFRPQEDEPVGTAPVGDGLRPAAQQPVGPGADQLDRVSTGPRGFAVGQMDRGQAGAA